MGTPTCMKFHLLFLLMAFVVSSCGEGGPNSRNKDIVGAVDEMERANYFTFVMLINMAPPDLFQGNVTFLMPNDRSLSKTVIPENAVVDFLLRHSIPFPLLFDYLIHMPTNTLLPTSNPELMLKVSNNGRKRYFLNNVRVISPNICAAGSSVRCHGIDGVLQAQTSSPAVPPPASPYNATIPSPIPEAGAGAGAGAPVPSPAPPADWSAPSPSAAPPQPQPQPQPQPDQDPTYKTSGGGSGRVLGWMELALTCMMFLAVKVAV